MQQKWHQMQTDTKCNFASNNLEYNKLKASTLILYIANWKA